MKKLQEFLQYFENTGDGAFAVDPSQRIVFWSQTAQELLGYTPEQVKGRCCYKLFAGRNLADEPFCRFHCILYERSNRGRPLHAHDLRVKNSDGKFVWINLSSIIIPDLSNGQAFGAIVHLFRLIEESDDEVPPLKIRLLGPVMVQRADGSPVNSAFRRRAKVRALFSLLALHRSQGIHRNDLLITLWPNLNHRAGLHNLNTCTYNLRRSLEPDLDHGPDSTYVRIRGERYFLAGGRTNWLDVETFETNLAAAQNEMQISEKARLYRQAIALYRGDFLADLDTYLLDCLTERERYRQLYLKAMQGLGDLLVGQKRDDEAANIYLKIIAKDNCNENAVQALMHLYMKNGKKNKTLSIYHQFKERLREKLGTQPTQKTQKMAEKARLQK